MLSILRNFFDSILVHSRKNIDNSVKELRDELNKNKLLTVEIFDLESSINQTDDEDVKYNLKCKLYNELKYLKYKESVDNAW